MTPRRKKRLVLVVFLLVGITLAGALALNAFQKNLLFFFSPAQVMAGDAPTGHPFRLGGMVVKGSVARESGSLTVRFDLTDNAKTIPVIYTGILPDLFREGQGIVAMGSLDGSGQFTASEVLAKHDENYMPPEVADALKAAKSQKVN